MTDIKNLKQAVICLHDVAQFVENQIGTGALSLDIRRVADRTNELIKTEVKKVPSKFDPDSIYMNTLSGKTHEG